MLQRIVSTDRLLTPSDREGKPYELVMARLHQDSNVVTGFDNIVPSINKHGSRSRFCNFNFQR